jgi:hypothetical protein
MPGRGRCASGGANQRGRAGSCPQRLPVRVGAISCGLSVIMVLVPSWAYPYGSNPYGSNWSSCFAEQRFLKTMGPGGS